MTFETLSELYAYTILTQGAASIPARFTLLVCLIVVFNGLSKPGNKLLTLCLAFHYLVSSFYAGGSEGIGQLLPYLAFLLCPLTLVYGLMDGVDWKVDFEQEWIRLALMAGLGLAIFFPFWPETPFLRGVFKSPMGLFPQQTILATLMLLACSPKTYPKLFLVPHLIVGGLIGVLDLVDGNRALGGVTFLLIAAIGVMMFYPTEGGLFIEKSDSKERDVTVKRERSIKVSGHQKKSDKGLEKKAPKKGGKKWDLR